MKHLLPLLEILRDSALRLGGADEAFIAETHGSTDHRKSVVHCRAVLQFEKMVAN